MFSTIHLLFLPESNAPLVVLFLSTRHGGIGAKGGHPGLLVRKKERGKNSSGLTTTASGEETRKKNLFGVDELESKPFGASRVCFPRLSSRG